MRWRRRTKREERPAEQEQRLAEFLTEAANAVVVTRAQGTPGDVDVLAAQLDEVLGEARRRGNAPIADYFLVLRGLLLGQDVAAQAAALAEPFDLVAEQVAAALAEIDAARTVAAGPPAGGDPDAEGTFGEVD